MPSLPLLAGNFGLEPMHISVLSPLGVFPTLQTSFYGGLIWFKFKLRVGGLEKQTAGCHKVLGKRPTPR